MDLGVSVFNGSSTNSMNDSQSINGAHHRRKCEDICCLFLPPPKKEECLSLGYEKQVVAVVPAPNLNGVGATQ
jgi:hypothetical protein